METTFAISRSVVDCVARYEIEGGPVMARGVDGPRGTFYSAMDGPGGPSILLWMIWGGLSILCPTTPDGGQYRGFDQRRLPLESGI